MTAKDRSRNTDVVDDAEHADPTQEDIGKPLDLSGDEIGDDLDVGNLDDLVASTSPDVDEED